MRLIPLLTLVLAALLLPGCKKLPDEVEVDTTREINSEDNQVDAEGRPKRLPLKMSSWRRFRPGQRYYVYKMPDGWEKRNATPFRKLNFAGGPSKGVEIYLSESMGGVIDNVNRWRGQFGQQPMGQGELGGLKQVMALGAALPMVELEGDYAPGMGKAPLPGYAMAGVIGRTGNSVLTIKMVGPKAAVLAERARFLEFCRGLDFGS